MPGPARQCRCLIGLGTLFGSLLCPAIGTAQTITEGDVLTGNATLGGAGQGGGNIQLHAATPSNVGEFGGDCLAEG
jgi:hypothetical protein